MLKRIRMLTCYIFDNPGLITVRGFQVKLPNLTTRVMSNHRDGVHCKNNRVGPVVENCHFEYLMDDSINMSQDIIFAVNQTGEEGREFKLDSLRWNKQKTRMMVGDRIKIFFPDVASSNADPYIETFVKSVSGKTVTFEDNIGKVTTITGYNEKGEIIAPATATHFYNMDASNRDYVVRNNTFGPQRRHAILARSEDGTIVGNVIKGVNGNGIVLENEYDNFRAGPFPQNVEIRNNHIENTAWSPVKIHASSGPENTRLVKNIWLRDNTLVTRNDLDVALDLYEEDTDGNDVSVRTAIEIENAENIFIGRGNKIYKGSANYNANILWTDPIDQKNVAYIGYPYLLDGSFEADFNDPESDRYEYRPAGTPWNFGPPHTASGYSKNSSDFTGMNADAPHGDQVLFLQGTGFAAQAVYFEPGMYNVSFLAAMRQGYYTTQQVSVLIDGVSVGQFGFSDPNSGAYAPNGFTTGNFAVTDGFHGIKLSGSVPGVDTTAFVDNVQVNQLYSFASVSAALSVLY